MANFQIKNAYKSSATKHKGTLFAQAKPFVTKDKVYDVPDSPV